MNIADVVVVGAGLVLSGFLAWFFFGPKKARQAELIGQVQEVNVTVRGGYSPDVIRVRQSVPLRIVFDRQESGECTSRVVFPDFALNRSLPAMARTAVEFTPDRSGRFGFACGMNMVHGTLIVESNGGPATGTHAPPATTTSAAAANGGGAVQGPADGDAEAAERRLEISD